MALVIADKLMVYVVFIVVRGGCKVHDSTTFIKTSCSLPVLYL